MRERQPLLSLVAMSVVVAGVLLTTAPVWAHSGSRQSPVVAAAAQATVSGSEIASSADRIAVWASQSSLALPTATSIALSLFGLCLAVAAPMILARRPRRLAAAALVVLVAIVAFESSLHAVHHLGDPDGAARCGVASVTSHLSGTADSPWAEQPTLDTTTEHVAISAPLPLDTRPLNPQRGRAPPSIAS